MSAAVILINRTIGAVPINVFLNESHSSELILTENPIEDGSNVNDHAILEPKHLTLEIADENASDTYSSLVAFQATMSPFDMVTGLAVYPNMIITGIYVERDKTTGKILRGTVELKEVKIVGTNQTVSAGVQADVKSIGNGGDAQTIDRISPLVQRGDARSITVAINKTTSIINSALS